ncbi:MAG: hypothetical protein KDD01_20355, partial [Phaeodactylibacter sp.]|nr:hypothetical protein [Phaeodactylibacter sp.]
IYLIYRVISSDKKISPPFGILKYAPPSARKGFQASPYFKIVRLVLRFISKHIKFVKKSSLKASSP